MSELVKEISEADFPVEVLQATVPVLVDFWAPWCGPCRRMGPMVEELAGEVAGKAKVCKVNLDEATGLGAQFKIQAIPCFLVFRGGKVTAQHIGGTDKATLTKLLGVV